MKKRLIIIFLLILILFIIIFFKVRSLFRLELVYKNNAGIPYEWQYKIEDKSIVKLDKCYVVKDENKNGKTGAPIHTKYVFVGLKKGNTKIKFKYVNFVDKKVIKEDVYNVKVESNKRIYLVK